MSELEPRYRARFAQLDAGGPLLAWNGEAAFTPLWGFKRRIPTLMALSVAFPALGIALAARVSLAAGFIVPTLVFTLLHGLLGDWFYHRSERRRAARLAALPEELRRRASQGVGRVEYALLVLLLVPLTALAILAADPTLRAASAARPFVEVIEGDLRRLVTVQAEYFADVGRYAEEFAPWTFAASPGVHLRILYADAQGFGADAMLGDRPERCFVFVGEARGMPDGAEPGTPTCTVDASF